MLRGEGFGYRGLRWGALGLSAVVAVAAFADAASARRSHRPKPSAGESYQPSYASIVVDANSGAVMQATNADSPRHPASLTKIMTLYLLFERLEQGKVKLTTDLPVSAHAAVQAPSKLGLKPGESIRVETAIRAIVTKSANDVAVIVAEALGGDEPSFARMMTAKAQALGMSQTVYRNASGLPDDQQITTARDQAILGRAIQDRFPNYYQYFATRTFEYRGKSIRNHNHLLGAVDGLDGIKTGYIHDSGFNIVTSVRRANHHVVAVVFGGRTADARDARVRSLIDNNINIAAVKRTAPPVIEGRETAVARRDSKDGKEDDRTGSAPVRVASAAQAPAPSATDAPAPGSTDPIKPVAVRTVAVHPGTVYTASLTPLPSDNRQLTPAPAVSQCGEHHHDRHRQKRAATGRTDGGGCPSAGFVSRRLTASFNACGCRARAGSRCAACRKGHQLCRTDGKSRVRWKQRACANRKRCTRRQTAWRVAHSGWRLARRKRSQAASGNSAKQGQRPAR